MSSARGGLFIISAPSGAGKGTVIQSLLELRPELVFSVSATTRAPRDGEVDGVSYSFVTHERFKQMISDDEFLEYAEYVGEFYGTPKSPVFASMESGKDVLLDIEVQGAKQVIGKVPGAVTIFIVPPDMDELERRLRGRGTDSEEKLIARMARARQEMLEIDFYDNIVINDVVSRAAGELLAIIENSQLKREQ